MNRDEHEALKENMTGVEQIALGSLPADILGEEKPSYVLDLQSAVNKAVSRATQNSRKWSPDLLRAAKQAAKPIVKKYMGQQGKAFTKDDVRTTTRKCLGVYTSQFGVALPGSMVLGTTDLQAMAGDICGAFSMPWQAFMPPQVILAKQAADAGKPRAKSWLKRLFGIKDKAPAAPVATPAAKTETALAVTAEPKAALAAPAAATTEAPATAPASTAGNTGSSDSLGVSELLGLGSSDSLGAWLHALNPLYWLKSKEERALIDKEKQAWIENAELQKKLGKKQQIMESAEKALAAKQAVEAAKARSAEMEAQLKAIESQVLGVCEGCNCGDQVVGADMQFVGPEKAGQFVGPEKAGQFVGAKKVGQFVGPENVEQFIGTEFMGADVRENPFTESIPATDAAPTLKKIATARKLNEANKAELDAICAKMQAKMPLSPDEVSKTLILLARNEQLHEFRKALVQGELCAGNPSAKKLQRQVTLGAMKALTPSEQQMVAQMITLAKQNNPNAKKALEALKAQGYAVTMGYDRPKATIVGKAMTPAEQTQLTQIINLAKQGNANAKKALEALQAQGYNVTSSMGFGISDAFRIATAPIVWSTQLVAKGAQKLFGRGGGGKGPASPHDLRLQRLQAAQKRRQAAAARARAADAETQAEYRSQQALAAAADAEADAADAEANAKEAAMITAEAQYAPAETPEYSADQSGASRPVITPLPPTPSKTAITFQKDVNKRLAKKTPLAHKILVKSEEPSPTGMKLKASMELYRKAKKDRKSPEYKAAAMMVKKAKAGDKQALADARALKAASIAVKAEKNAQKHVARVYAYRAVNAKGKAVQKRAEVAMSDKLIRQSRAAKLRKVAKIERMAAAGSPKHVAFVKTHVAKAKAGDKKSQEVVAALRLTKHVREAAPTRREKRNLVLAHRQIKKVAKGNRKAIMQTRVIASAAKAGNPNAKRARQRLQTAAAYERTLATGAVVLPAVIITSEIALKREQAKKAQVAQVENKVAKGSASREEVQAAAKNAQDLGNKEKARELATVAATLPSAGESLKQTAGVLAAADAGSPAHAAALAKATTKAEAGDPAAVEAMGKVVAVKELNQVATGKPMSPEMKTAVADQVAAQAGDQVAQEKLATMQTQAAAKDPVAIKYMVAATGAAVVAKALSANPVAMEQWHQKAGIVPVSTETEDTQVVTAEILPPRSTTLPDESLPPVRGIGGLFKAALQALTLTTKDPFANYREGVASRARRSLPAVSSAGSAVGPAIAAAATGVVAAAATSMVKDQMTAGTKKAAGAGVALTKKGRSKPQKASQDDDNEEVSEGDGTMGKAAPAPAPAAVRPPAAGKLIDVSKEPKLKAKYTDENDYEVFGEGQPRNVAADEALTQSIIEAFRILKEKPLAPEPRHMIIMTRRRLAERAAKGDSEAQAKLTEIDRLLPLDMKVTPSLLGHGVHDDHKHHVEPTKNRLADIKAKADKGDKDAQKKWATATTNYNNAKAKADKGDEKAKQLVAVLEATGLFKK